MAIALMLALAPVVLAAARVVVSPSNGLAGATVRVTATGFPVGDVEFLWDAAGSLGSAATDSTGRASRNVSIPANAAPGSHFIRACAAACATFADGKVTVIPPPTPSPAPTPVPTAVPTVPPTAQPTIRPTATPAGTPRPTPRPSSVGPTPVPTPRPPGVTAPPTGMPPPTAAQATDLPDAEAGSGPPTDTAPPPSATSSGGSSVPFASAAAQVVGSDAPPTALAEPVGSVGGDTTAGRLLAPFGLIAVVVIAGIVLARFRGRRPAELAIALDGAEAAAPRAADVGQHPAGADPAPEREQTLTASTAPPTPPGSGFAPPSGSWANARTISIHVEQVDSGPD